MSIGLTYNNDLSIHETMDQAGQPGVRSSELALTHSLDYGEEGLAMEATQTCSHPDGCPRPVIARGLCHAHWARWKKSGDLGPAMIRERLPAADVCSHEACPGASYAKGFCKTHYYRWKKHGDAGRVDQPPGLPGLTGADHPAWKGKEISYAGAHTRVYSTRGSAADHMCVDGCGQRAEHWSYTYEDPEQLLDSAVGHYSVDPQYYVPRCRSCHRKHDYAARRRMADGN